MNEIEKLRCERFNELIGKLKSKRIIKRNGDFALSVGVSVGYMTNIKSLSCPISESFAKRICDAYPVNYEWLMFGHGDMLTLNNNTATLSIGGVVSKLCVQVKEINNTLEQLCSMINDTTTPAKHNVSDYLNVVLEDDDTEFSGISYVGETLDNFLAETNIDPNNTTIEEVNKALVECGIKPIKL